MSHDAIHGCHWMDQLIPGTQDEIKRLPSFQELTTESTAYLGTYILTFFSHLQSTHRVDLGHLFENISHSSGFLLAYNFSPTTITSDLSHQPLSLFRQKNEVTQSRFCWFRVIVPNPVKQHGHLDPGTQTKITNL